MKLKEKEERAKCSTLQWWGIRRSKSIATKKTQKNVFPILRAKNPRFFNLLRPF